MNANPGTSRQPLASIQVMRGIAAFAVVVYHTHLILSRAKYGGIDLFGPVANKGWLGVNFFFVLSGFIIPFAHFADIGRPARAWRYVWRRLSRVYPLYWLVLCVVLLAAAAVPAHSEFSWAAPNLLAAFLLIDFIPHPTLPLQVAWTLFYEMAYYFAFLLIILNARIGTVLVAGWWIVIAWIALVQGNGEPGWYLHAWNLYFLCGMATFAIFRRYEGKAGGIWLMGGGILLLLAMMVGGMVAPSVSVTQAQPLTLLALALPFSAILLGGVMVERQRGTWRPPYTLRLLGDASFAVYLIHSPIISTLALVNSRFGKGHVPSVLLYFAIIAIATAVGLALHLAVEKPLLARMRGIADKARPARPLAADTRSV